MDSFNYVNSISQDEGVKVRDSDRATSISLMIVSIVTVGAMLIEPLAPHRMPLLCLLRHLDRHVDFLLHR